jgi:hypothetical protein
VRAVWACGSDPPCSTGSLAFVYNREVSEKREFELARVWTCNKLQGFCARVLCGILPVLEWRSEMLVMAFAGRAVSATWIELIIGESEVRFESTSISWPNAITDAGGIIELSVFLLQEPPPPHALWEAIALVLSNVLWFSSQYYFKVPAAVLVKLPCSSNEATKVVALSSPAAERLIHACQIRTSSSLKVTSHG